MINRKTEKKRGLLAFVLLFAVGCIINGPVVLAAATDTGNKTVTVTFNPQGGTVTTGEKTVTPGSSYGTLPVPVKENYTFRAWYILPSAGTLINADKKVTISKDHVLYAQWSGKECSIALDANGGTLQTDSITIRYGTKYLSQLPTPARADYNFTGWFTQKNGGDKILPGTAYKDNPPAKLYAGWEKKVLTVQFIGFNGETYEKDVTCGSTYGTLPKPVKEGYTFNGWYTWADYSKMESTPVAGTAKVTETSPVMLFARWR